MVIFSEELYFHTPILRRTIQSYCIEKKRMASLQINTCNTTVDQNDKTKLFWLICIKVLR